ncbi:MAG: ABC transporter ATP-binding protein [Nitrospirae bacterium]|nr:ABC transporter ATP-binding protein [Nitrospirota bacterium]
MIRAEGIVYPVGGGVLAGLSLRVGEGEFLGILGENGSGKTLLLEILATLRLPCAGGLSLMGKDALRSPEEVRPFVGFVPEEIPRMEGVSVSEYLSLFAWCYGLGSFPRTEWHREILGRLGLEGSLSVALTGLSPGGRKRVSMARSVLHRPKVLILDNPLSGLDDPERGRVSAFLRGLRADGVALVGSAASRSDLGAERIMLYDRMAVLRQGELKPCPLPQPL